MARSLFGKNGAPIPPARGRRTLVDYFGEKVSSQGPVSHADALTRDAVVARVEAALFISHDPISPRRLMKVCGLPDTGEVRRAVTALNELLKRGASAFVVEEIAGGYQLLSRPDLRPWVERLSQVQSETPLSGPMLETLAIVAYRQPICRADVEAIRGVQVGEILRNLLETGLIRLAGKDDSLGRPFLYGTTPKFLQVFGLRNLHELPMAEMLAPPPPEAPPEATDDLTSDDEDAVEDEEVDESE